MFNPKYIYEFQHEQLQLFQRLYDNLTIVLNNNPKIRIKNLKVTGSAVSLSWENAEENLAS